MTGSTRPGNAGRCGAIQGDPRYGVQDSQGQEKGSRKRTGQRIMPATVNRELACLKAIFNHAIKSDLPVRNPVSRVAFLAE